ncbi:MAG: HAD hydrolase-like protein [bacterium]|nr:HAD hydrolase-like protein [bacterium]
MKPDWLLLFDIDGTLLRTQSVGRESTRAAMLDVFGTASTIDTHVFGGKTDWQTLVELLEPHGYSAEIIGQHMPYYEDVIAGHIAQIIHPGNAAACPYALETIESLRHDPRYLLGIVTGNVSTTSPYKLRAAGFDPAWFAVGAYGSEAVDRDHLPALALERACIHCGEAISADRVMVIGDTLADIRCARAAGAVAVAVCTGFASREELAAANPDYLLDDLRDLPLILERLS